MALSEEARLARNAKARVRQRAYRERGGERVRTLQREWNRRNADRVNAKRRATRRSSPGSRRAESLRQRWGKDEAWLAAQIAAQGGGCGLCGLPAAEAKRGLHIDHDHATGAIRGLLCLRCNQAMERFDNVPGFAEVATAWLARPALGFVTDRRGSPRRAPSPAQPDLFGGVDSDP